MVGSVKDYQGVLDRTSWCTLVVATTAAWYVLHSLGLLDGSPALLNHQVRIWDNQVPLGPLAAGLVIAFLARALRLHDRLSDLLRIREDFDVILILEPLAAGAGVNLTAEDRAAVRARRVALMDSVFYRYASSGSDAPLIDAHLVRSALEQWSWYWCVVEACAIVAASAIVVLTTHDVTLVLYALVMLSGLQLLLEGLMYLCERHATREVTLILASHERRGEIAEAFRAVQN